jgi:hypothetical protein
MSALSGPVPSVAEDLSDLRIGDLSGFREQELWGRWTLGKTATISLQAKHEGWAEVQLDMSLPYPQQHLQLSLNGQVLIGLTGPQKNAHLVFALPLELRAGRNRFEILTDRSNLDPSSSPFAPQDKTDIAVSLAQIEFAPLQVFTPRQMGRVYGVGQLPPPITYQSVSEQGLTLFARLSGPRLLNYRLLSAADQQTFDFQLDGRSMRTVNAGPRGSLVQGQLPLDLDGSLHQVRIVVQGVASPHNARSGIAPYDTVRVLEQLAGPFPFAVQELSFSQRHYLQTWAGPLAGAGALMGVLLLALLLFGRRRGVRSVR